MPGRHQQRPNRRFGLRWVAGAVGIGVASAAILATAPTSSAATTTAAQLSLSGVATKANVLGGTTIGVHPGDTVKFSASATPTAGLDNVSTLSSLVSTILGTLTSYQVTANLSGLPGGQAATKLSGAAVKSITFPKAGTYRFTWTATTLGVAGTPIPLNFTALKSAGIAVNASGTWSGQVVVATNPPPPGISIQLPGVSVAPSLPGVGQLPTISLPTLNGPTIPVNVPSLLPSIPGLPGGGKTTTPGSGSGPAAGGGVHTTPGGECVPCEVVPSPNRFPGVGAVGPDAGGVTRIGAGLAEGSAASAPRVTATAAPPTTTTAKRIDLAANRAPGAQMPVLLAIVAIIALSLVTATYARLYLLRRDV